MAPIPMVCNDIPRDIPERDPVCIITVGHRPYSVPSTDMAAQCSTARTLWPAGLYAYAYTQRALRACSGHTHFRTWRVAKMEITITPSHRELAMSSRKGQRIALLLPALRRGRSPSLLSTSGRRSSSATTARLRGYVATVVEMLCCEACRNHEDGITSMNNISKVRITGSSNQKTSNIVDHATSEQHRAATLRVRADAVYE